MLLHMCRIQVPVFALAPHGKLVLAGRERSEIKRCLQRRTPVTKRRQAGCRRSRPSVGIDHPDFVRARTETGREPDGDVQTAARQRKRLTQAFRLPPARAVFSQIDIDAERLRRQLSPCNLFDWLDCTGVLVWWCGILESEGREPEEASYDDDSRRDCSPFQPLGKLISHTVSRCRSRAEIPVDPAATVPATAATASWPRVRVTTNSWAAALVRATRSRATGEHVMEFLERRSSDLRARRFRVARFAKKLHEGIDPIGVGGVEANGSNPLPRD